MYYNSTHRHTNPENRNEHRTSPRRPQDCRNAARRLQQASRHHCRSQAGEEPGLQRRACQEDGRADGGHSVTRGGTGRGQGRKPRPAEEATKPRSVRLNDARWEKLKRLGAEWLARQIDKAKEPHCHLQPGERCDICGAEQGT